MWLCKAFDSYDFTILEVLGTSLKSWLQTVDTRLSHTMTRLELSRSRRGVNTIAAFFDITDGAKVISEVIADAEIRCSEIDLLRTRACTFTVRLSCVGKLRPHCQLEEIVSELIFTLEYAGNTLHVLQIQTGGKKTSYDQVRIFLKHKESELDRFQ
jgi:hypothetical protein